MKRITLLLFILTLLSLKSNAQTRTEIDSEKQILLNVKSLLEKHFAGTNLRSIQKSFEIKPNPPDGYSFTSEVNDLFSEKSNSILSTKLNKVLKLKDNTKLTGLLYFDERIDSVLVDIEYKREDTVYTFISMSGYAVPRGGFEAFSKRLHDFIKEQIKTGKLLKDSILTTSSVNLMVNKDGTFIRNGKNYLSNAFDIFLASEPRWNPGIGAGKTLSTVVIFSIIPYYINGDAWPSNDNMLKTYHDDNYFDGHVNIYTIAFLHDQNIPVFYSYKLLNHSSKTIVSAVYDNILNEYRMITVHDGSLSKANRLINLIRKEASKKFYSSECNYCRIYFMLD